MRQQKPGYILVLTVTLVSLLVVMVTQIFNRGSAYLAYTTTIEKREQAKMLAISGVRLALSQLYVKKPEQKQGKDEKPPSEEALFLKQVLPILNRWQTISVHQGGLDGDMKIYIACEDGKLNLNNLDEFEKQDFKGTKQEQEMFRKKILDKVKSIVHTDADLFIGLEKLFKKNRINDVTQLLERPEYIIFANKVFVKPDMNITNPEIVLTDLFTTWSQEDGIEPWMFSQSMADVLGLQGAARATIESKKESLQTWIKLFKPTVQWQQEWNTSLGKVYGVDYKTLPQGIEGMLATKFGPKVFSVVSYGIAGEIIQKVFAIVVRSGNSYGDIPYRIKKLYWI